MWIAESDDVAEADFLKVLVEHMEEAPDMVLAFSHSRLIDREGNDMHVAWHKPIRQGTRLYDARQFVWKRMLTSNYVYNASMALFRLTAYRKMKQDFSRFRYCGDWLFWADLCLTEGKVAEVSSVLNNYRQHPTKVTFRANDTGH